MASMSCSGTDLTSFASSLSPAGRPASSDYSYSCRWPFRCRSASSLDCWGSVLCQVLELQPGRAGALGNTGRDHWLHTASSTLRCKAPARRPHPAEAAAYVERPIDEIYEHIQQGILAARRVGGEYRIDRDTLIAYARASDEVSLQELLGSVNPTIEYLVIGIAVLSALVFVWSLFMGWLGREGERTCWDGSNRYSLF